MATWSVGADGVDANGERRSPGGNPQTGPFYVEGALPGDTLVVRVNRVRTNRAWAVSSSRVMPAAVEPGHLAGLKWADSFNHRWTIDAAAGIARLDRPPDALKEFTVPLRPMLGCIAVAPAQQWAIRTTDSGRFGGNMDYNELVEGATVYLTDSQCPGRLLPSLTLVPKRNSLSLENRGSIKRSLVAAVPGVLVRSQVHEAL